MPAPADHQLSTIAVDLTPVLPGGENGGAKVFVLELISRLAELAPQTQFVLLTRDSSHEELSSLDRTNVRRIMVLGESRSAPLQSAFGQALVRIFRHLPSSLRTIAGRAGYSLKAASRRTSSSPILRGLKADLLFCPFTAPTFAEAAIPTVSVIYDLQYKTYPEFFAAEDVAHRDRTFVEASKRSTMLAAISDYSRQTAIERGGIDPSRIKTIHLHISKARLRNAKKDETVLDRLNLLPRKYLIYPANFWKHKNHEMLLTAFGMARSRGLADDIKLVCTGAPGERQSWLKQASIGLGLDQSVILPGYLKNAELLALISESAGVVFPSLYEGFGLPVIEAMATDVPVACSNVTSLPEVAGGAAILFDPRVPEQIAGAIVSLAHDRELTARLVEAGKTQAARFTDSSAMAQEYWQTFLQAAGAGVTVNMLFGAYPDGWSGPRLTVQIAPSSEDRRLELEVALPGWTPNPQVSIIASHKHRKVSEMSLAKGETSVLAIPLPQSGGFYELELDPPFVPAQSGMGDDARELTAQLLKCRVITGAGDVEVLFPEDTPQ